MVNLLTAATFAAAIASGDASVSRHAAFQAQPVGFSSIRAPLESPIQRRFNVANIQSVAAGVDTAAALARAATEARGLAMDSIAAAKSGHLGLPLGCADIGAVLFGQELSYNPDDPEWINRDRFVLSGGHGSMFLYAWLHMAGYDLPKEEVANFRQLDSKTPGHPEFGWTPGVESTTGPLGQGIGNMIGMAAAAKLASAQFNTDDHKIIDHVNVALCGDGCLQEGVAMEAMAFAAHEGLDNAILLYDSNGITLDKPLIRTQSEDVTAKLEAIGWEVITVDGHDMDAFTKAFQTAKTNKNGKPKAIICKTIIGKGIDEVAGKCAGHGEAGVAYVDASKAKLGLPEEKWYVSPDTQAFFADRKAALVSEYDSWQSDFAAWKGANPGLASTLQNMIDGTVPDNLMESIPVFKDGVYATRNAGAEVLNAVAAAMPSVNSGSADLHGSTKNYIKNAGDWGKDDYSGRNFYYGIREHGMGAILNGMGFYGLHRPSGATFLVFSDYMRGSVRVAALSHLPIGYIWTHDSIGVGEDGPTHQPVETVSSLRMIPNLNVFRPGDAEETAGAYVGYLSNTDGPTALILSRQDLPLLPGSAESKRQGVLKGAYVLIKETGKLENIILASGSEVQFAVEAAKELGAGTRVVSMPCMEIFDASDPSYKEEILPKAVTKRVSIEAGVTAPWYKYVGLDGVTVGVDRFGLSAPGDTVYKQLGITTDAVVKAVKSL